MQGMDIPNIPRIYQWRVTCDLNTLWQRFGRAARGPGTEAIAVLFAESKYFDEEKEKAAKAAEARAAKAATKAVDSEKGKRSREASDIGDATASKRQRVSGDQSTAESHGVGQTASNSPPTVTESPRTSDAASLTVYEQLRIKYRAHSMVGSVAPTQLVVTPSSEPRPEMDAFINAATRTGCCFRLPIMAYYENDRRSKYSSNVPPQVPILTIIT